MPAGPRKRRRIHLICAAVLLLALATIMIGYAAREGIAYFRSPSEVAALPDLGEREVFRLGGLVEDGSLAVDGRVARFRVTDGSHRLPVEYTGILPDLFREGQGVVATGRLVSGTFMATEILAKHDENYMPKEVVEILKQEGLFKPAE